MRLINEIRRWKLKYTNLDELIKSFFVDDQYEKGKPLINLVDNMVKLGSLYNRNTANGSSSITASRNDLFQENTKNHRDRLEFNQRVQEQRLLAEERRDWNRLSPDHGQLQVIGKTITSDRWSE